MFSFQLEIKFSAGFMDNPENGSLEAFIKLHICVMIYGQISNKLILTVDK